MDAMLPIQVPSWRVHGVEPDRSLLQSEDMGWNKKKLLKSTYYVNVWRLCGACEIFAIIRKRKGIDRCAGDQ